MAPKEDLFDFFDEAWFQMLVSMRSARVYAGCVCRALLACLPPVPEGEEVSQAPQGIP